MFDGKMHLIDDDILEEVTGGQAAGINAFEKLKNPNGPGEYQVRMNIPDNETPSLKTDSKPGNGTFDW